MNSEDIPTKLLISFRGQRAEMALHPDTSVLHVKTQLASSIADKFQMLPDDFKLIHKGKVLSDNRTKIFEALIGKKSASKNGVIRLMATGVSSAEAKEHNSKMEHNMANAPRVRDDLTEGGRRELAARRKLGRSLLEKAAKREALGQGEKYGFARMETLPMLPDGGKAKQILSSLANDPGILACMRKHRWNVGCLAEMYPEGKVGESEVCIMGLNQNRGQKILLRLRTDDLKGFRKILSIRKVLFHELAHNVHSEHNGEFFKLMRQVENECNEMNWTQGSGQSVGGGGSSDFTDSMDDDLHEHPFRGGAYRLGGGEVVADENRSSQPRSTRELAARAALMRLSKEEEEIEQACGCGKNENQFASLSGIRSESVTTSENIEDNDRSGK